MFLPERPRLVAEDVLGPGAQQRSVWLACTSLQVQALQKTKGQRGSRTAAPCAGKPGEWLTGVPEEMRTRGPSIRNQKPWTGGNRLLGCQGVAGADQVTDSRTLGQTSREHQGVNTKRCSPPRPEATAPTKGVPQLPSLGI